MIDDNDKAASGLEWCFELESIVLEIIGEADGILEEDLLDLLIQRPELQTLLAKFAEFVQKIPELKKKHGESKLSIPRKTIRDELKILLEDLTNGAIHGIYQEGAHQKLEKFVGKNGNKSDVFIKRITDDYSLR